MLGVRLTAQRRAELIGQQTFAGRYLAVPFDENRYLLAALYWPGVSCEAIPLSLFSTERRAIEFGGIVATCAGDLPNVSPEDEFALYFKEAVKVAYRVASEERFAATVGVN